MEQMLNEMTARSFESKLISNVVDKRRWVIRTEIVNGEKRIVYCGGWGEGKRMGYLDPVFVKDIIKYNIRWYEFSYKKDYEKTLNFLKKEYK